MQLFTWFEPDGLAWGNAYFSSSARVTSDAGLTGAYAENAEAPQFNSFAGSQSLLQAFDYGIDRCLRFDARQAGALDYVVNNVLLNQGHTLVGVLK